MREVKKTKVTPNEHLVAKEIIRVLLSKNITHGMAKRILKDAKKELGKLPVKEREYLCELPKE